MKTKLFMLSLFITTSLFCQEYNLKTNYLLGTFHAKNTTINGFSFGVLPNLKEAHRFVKTNGIRFEIPGLGILAPIGNGSRISGIESVKGKFNRKDYKFDEIINGINISGGSIGEINFNGITLAGIAQFGILNNGIAIAGVWNAMDKSNGMQISLLLNESLYNNGVQVAIGNNSIVMNGVQIGILNESKKLRGFQFGLWNKNGKRSLPLINWQFKD